MRRFVLPITLLLVLVCPQVAAAVGPPQVSSAELVERAAEWDGKMVTFTGEAIGEAMARGDLTWLHLNDDAYSRSTVPEGAELAGYNSGQAVIVDTEAARAVQVFGDFGHRGDIVQVTGQFHAADPQYGGDMTIEATTLRVVAPGQSVPRTLPGARVGWLIFSLAAAALSWTALRLRKHGDSH